MKKAGGREPSGFFFSFSGCSLVRIGLGAHSGLLGEGALEVIAGDNGTLDLVEILGDEAVQGLAAELELLALLLHAVSFRAGRALTVRPLI
jgi:hypothetical protein